MIWSVRWSRQERQHYWRLAVRQLPWKRQRLLRGKHCVSSIVHPAVIYPLLFLAPLNYCASLFFTALQRTIKCFRMLCCIVLSFSDPHHINTVMHCIADHRQPIAQPSTTSLVNLLCHGCSLGFLQMVPLEAALYAGTRLSILGPSFPSFLGPSNLDPSLPILTLLILRYTWIFNTHPNLYLNLPQHSKGLATPEKLFPKIS